MKWKASYVFGVTVFICLLVHFWVRSTPGYRLHEIERYESAGNNEGALLLKERIIRKQNLEVHNPLVKLQRLDESHEIFFTKEIADDLFSKNDYLEADTYYKFLENLILKQVREGTFVLDIEKILPPEYHRSPYWRYRYAMALAGLGDWENAQKIFQSIFKDYPYLASFQKCNQSIQNKTLDACSFDIVGHWKLDGTEKQGFIEDASGFAQYGRAASPDWVLDQGHRAISFSGKKNQNVTIGYHERFRLPQRITVAYWMKIYRWSDAYSVHPVMRHFDVIDSNFNFYLDGQHGIDKMTVLSSTASGNWTYTSPWSKSLPLNAWIHVAWAYDEKGGRLYINGELQGQSPWFGNLGESRGTPLIVGHEPFAGALDDLIIFDRALSENEIKFMSKNF